MNKSGLSRTLFLNITILLLFIVLSVSVSIVSNAYEVADKSADINNIDTNESKICDQESVNGPITIRCYGDSVTGGVGMPDNHSAVIGGSSYPSVLYTLLANNGINAIVENAGQGGENTSAIISRLGASKLIINEDLYFDNEGCAGPIDKKITAYFGDNISYPLKFSGIGTDINPIIINGNKYEAELKELDDKTSAVFLYKNANDPTTIIKAGESVELSSTSHNDVNIIFAGINDDNSVTIDEFVAMLKCGAAVNGNKYIIIGPYSRVFDRKGFVPGYTTYERYKYFINRMKDEFGNHFIDMYSDWYKNALSVALANGYFNDLTDSQIDIIQNKLNNHIVPAEYAYNHKENNVHLNKIGYTVLAHIVYERLNMLGYLK